MLKIGLTGGIGSGKTTVAEQFATIGTPIIDTDAISHQLSRKPEIIDEICASLGNDILDTDGHIDRRKLAAMVFSDPDKREQLEAILHPKIRTEVAHQLQNFGSAHYVIIVVPLLLETDFHQLVDRILVVDISEQQQIDRVSQRDGRSEQAIRDIMANQVSRKQRLERADDKIENTGTAQQLADRVNELDQAYRKLAQGGT